MAQDILSAGVAALGRVLRSHAAQSILYKRGTAVVQIDATKGSTLFESDTASGGLLRIESRDFIFEAERLVIEGDVTTPARGDKIEEMQGGKTYTYEVLDLGAGTQPWRYCDPYRTLIRVHTKKIDVLT